MVGPDLSGTVLDGRYRLVSLLGMGGMGQVYRGIHLSLDRTVAIKILPAQLSQDPRFRARFAREARAVAKIAHRNVVQIMDYGESPNGPVYFVMEFLEGRDLGALLREEGRLTWPRAQHLLLQAVSAIKVAHAHGIIHRDIKPGNCFVLDLPHERLTDVVKVLDFGIAKVVTEGEAEGSTPAKPLTGTGEIVGTASYMAPEQARGEPLDHRSDVYSLGIMAYEMLTGRVPFVGANPIHVVTRHLYDRPEPLHVVVPGILPEVEALVLRAIAKDPGDRFASMAELEAAILAIRDMSMDSARMRALATVGTVARIESGQLPRVSGMRNDATIVLHEVEARSFHEAGEVSLEDAVTPEAPVLRPRFGEPSTLRRSKDDAPFEPRVEGDEHAPAEPAGGDDADPSEAQPTARVRLVADPNPKVVSDSPSADDITVDVSPARRSPVVAVASEPSEVPAAEPANVPSDTDLDSAPTPLAAKRPLAPKAKETPRSQPRTTSWRKRLGLVLLLGGAAAMVTMMVSRGGVERPTEEVAITQPSQTHGPRDSTPRPAETRPRREHVEEPNAKPLRSDPQARGVPENVAEASTSKPTTTPTDAAVGGTESSAGGGALDTAPEAPAARPPKPKPKPYYESDDCRFERDQAIELHDVGDYVSVIRYTAPGPCWPPHMKLKRLKLRLDALSNKKRFADCVTEGRGITDPDIVEITNYCKSKLE